MQSLRDNLIEYGCKQDLSCAALGAPQDLPLFLTSCPGWVGLGESGTPGMGEGGVQPDRSFLSSRQLGFTFGTQITSTTGVMP